MKAISVAFALLGVICASQATFTTQRCSTKLGPTSVKHVKTSTKTSRITLTASKKLCPKITKTITPKVKTTTLTSINTEIIRVTLPQDTDTITTTVTATSTSTKSESTTTTSVSSVTTVTTTTPTSTVPTPAGFTPAISASGYVAKRDIPGRFSLAPRGKVNNNVPQPKICKVVGDKSHHYPPVFPQSVHCQKLIKTLKTKTITVKYCKHNPTRTTTLPRKTSTRFTTVTEIVISTVGLADVTVTATASETSTSITTTTSTETENVTITETQTSVAPSATVYAACARDNIISSANGGHDIFEITINQPSSSGPYNTLQAGSSGSAYACCVSCQTTTNCVYSALNRNGCYLIISAVCDPSRDFGTGYRTDSEVSGTGFTISNGPCGQSPNLGSQ
ncbi:hypothetical protein FHETE_7800 [Fusarium heterosporum]|uniref:Apple domain-containing protein n=1 Tax=Fusarium heterosporum TaxID=42747 RepID=A0A8H5SZ84_FUSHE|nr:hypothetical protein FHETE_7800 [Fusarium heterosporum]